jgi:hypothetical protein
MKKLLFIVLFSITLNSCFIGKAIEVPKMRKEFTEKNDAIPPEFGEDKNAVILVIKRGRNSYDKGLKSAVKRYSGKYLLINRDELVNYSDISKYRYIFDYSGGSTHTTQYSNGLSASSTYKRFYVYDRLNDRSYQSGAEFTFFGKAMKVYFENLNIKYNSK